MLNFWGQNWREPWEAGCDSLMVGWAYHLIPFGLVTFCSCIILVIFRTPLGLCKFLSVIGFQIFQRLYYSNFVLGANGNLGLWACSRSDCSSMGPDRWTSFLGMRMRGLSPFFLPSVLWISDTLDKFWGCAVETHLVNYYYELLTINLSVLLLSFLLLFLIWPLLN
jgi:hypothetical protein